MPITINGTGTITGVSAGGLPSSSVTTANIADNAVTYAKIGTTEQGQLCKAWVNFNGTGTVAIRASYNVSSITDNGTGDYTVNFTTALADANYAWSGSINNNASNYLIYGWTSAPTTTSLRLATGNTGTFVDSNYINVAIFR